MARIVDKGLVVLLCGGLLLAGCSRSAETPHACSENTARLETHLDRLVREGRGLPRPVGWQGVAIPTRGKPLDSVRTLLVGTSSVELNGVPIDEHQLGIVLDNHRELAGQMMVPAPTRLAVAVDRRVQWGSVVKLANAAVGSGFTEILWTFPVHGQVAQPSTTETVSLSVDPGVMDLEQALGEACAVLDTQRAHESLAGAAQVGSEVASALRRCGCQVDEERVRKAFWRLLGRHQGGPATTFATMLGKDRDHAVRVEAPADRPFSQVALALVRASRRHEHIGLAAH